MPSNVRKYDYSCKFVVENNQKMYQCKTCDTSEQQYICLKCKRDGNHRGHNITEVTNDNLTRFCNCGDGTGQYQCSKHRAQHYPDAQMPLYLNSHELDLFTQIFGIDSGLTKILSRLNQIRKIALSSVDGKMIQTYFNKTNAHQIKINLHRCWSVYRKDHEQNFCDKKYNKIRRLLLWHGTKVKNLPGILENGFRKPSQVGVANGSMFGRGLYFADRVSKSAQYTDCSGMRLLFLCEVALGSMWRTGLPRNYDDVPSSYNSIKGLGKKIPDRSEETKFDDINVPSGKTVNCTLDKIKYSELNYNEYIVFDPERILIKFILAFRCSAEECVIS